MYTCMHLSPRWGLGLRNIGLLYTCRTSGAKTLFPPRFSVFSVLQTRDMSDFALLTPTYEAVCLHKLESLCYKRGRCICTNWKVCGTKRWMARGGELSESRISRNARMNAEKRGWDVYVYACVRVYTFRPAGANSCCNQRLLYTFRPAGANTSSFCVFCVLCALCDSDNEHVGHRCAHSDLQDWG